MNPELFWAKVDTSGECWLWTGYINEARGGYGYFSWRENGKACCGRAHRIAYKLLVGDPPPELDHRYTCPKHCVRPGHMRAVTRKQGCENLGSLPRHNTSGAMGVSRSGDRWRACVSHNGEFIHLGYFDDIKQAEAAALAKRLELFTHNDRDRASIGT